MVGAFERANGWGGGEVPIAVNCACGKSFHVKDELAGKHIKCPGCQAVVQVTGGGAVTANVPPQSARPQEAPPRPAQAIVIEDEPAPARIADKARLIDDDDVDDAPPPREARSKKKGKKGSNIILFVGLGVGALLLGLCCIGGGVAVWFFVATPTPEKAIVGKWKADVAATKKLYAETDPQIINFATDESKLGILEFKSDGTMEISSNNVTIKCKWKLTNIKGDKAVLEIIETRGNNTVTTEFDLVVKERNLIHTIPKTNPQGNLSKGVVWKRI
jgi:hypothetical protein